LNGLLVRDVRDDPRSGKTTKELTNLSQSDPDPATFQPPAGTNRDEGIVRLPRRKHARNSDLGNQRGAGSINIRGHIAEVKRCAYWLENDARPLLPAILLF